MATAVHPSPVPTPSAAAGPPTPPMAYPNFPRIPQGAHSHSGHSAHGSASGSSPSSPHPSVQRNASTSSSRSNTTSSSTSSLLAAPIRPPPIETRTAATTTPVNLPSRPSSTDTSFASPANGHGNGFAYGNGHGGSGYNSDAEPPVGHYGGRGFSRNGPRTARQATTPLPPAIVTYPHQPLRGETYGGGATVPYPPLSPTTPRALHSSWFANEDLRPDTPEQRGPVTVTVSLDDVTPPMAGPSKGRSGIGSTPASPIARAQRNLSVDGRRPSTADGTMTDRERRQSVASQGSASGQRKHSLRDYVLGEELGRGSYSTVVQATLAAQTQSPTSPRPPRQFAIKIISQSHLVAEKKAKYAKIERDALIRLATPRQSATSPTSAKGHRRGMSSSSSAGIPSAVVHASGGKRRSSTSLAGAAASSARRDSAIVAALPIPQSSARDRLSVVTTLTDSTSSGGTYATSPLSSVSNVPLSPTLMAGRRPSRSADPPEVVPERSEDGHSTIIDLGIRSRPPSPVREEGSPEKIVNVLPPDGVNLQGIEEKLLPTPAPSKTSFDISRSPDLSRDGFVGPRERHGNDRQTPRKRRQSLAPSERSVKSGRVPLGHPGIIRLHSTFNDDTSLYFVLDLAKNGEMLSWIRKYGSFDLESARYYTAQLVDTIEFMHDKGVIHRDLKPENILLDGDMRTKITDFGSAKLLFQEGPAPMSAQDDGKKRSFVGSADFVSPEVLRNEVAVPASDIWAIGCILYHLIVGKPPFRGATDYLTFQKILKKDMSFPPGFDPDAQALVELILNLDPTKRPSIAEIKAHPFFATVDWSTLWTCSAPILHTGLNKTVTTLATVDPNSDIWAVFDDEVSDGGFEYDDGPSSSAPSAPQSPTIPQDLSREPRLDHHAAAQALHSTHAGLFAPAHEAGSDLENSAYGDLEPPRRAWMGGSRSARTSSSSSGNRMALTGLLESMKLQSPIFSGSPATRGGSSRTSRTSVRSEEIRVMMGQGQKDKSAPNGDLTKWQPLLLANEKIVHTSHILVRPPSTHIPSFLLTVKHRQLILTDFPRLITVKEEPSAPGGLQIKNECVFVSQPSAASGWSRNSRGEIVGTASIPNRVMDVQDRGRNGFLVQTAANAYHFVADTEEEKDKWMVQLRRVVA